VLKTDFKLSPARQITANAAYIVYGLRAGQLRCINKATAGRALYKGHAAPVSDAAFYSWESNLLASVSAAGDLFVRLIVEAGGDPQAAPVMRASLPAPPADGAARLAWHPLEPRVLAAASGGAARLYMVPSEAAAPASDASDAAAAALPETDASAELPLPGGAAASALAFSPAGDVLVAGGADGAASAWALDAALGGGGGGVGLTWPASGPSGGAVSAAMFLSQAAPGAACALATADATGRVLRLWRLPGVAALSAGAGAQLLQTLELASGKGPSDFYCHLGHSPRAALLLLANMKRNQVHALHYGVADTGADGPNAAVDYAATFSVKQAVMSFAAGYEVTESEATPGQMDGAVTLYCVQPDAVQQYTLDPALCTPGPEEAGSGGGAGGAGAAGTGAGEPEGEEEATSAPAAPPAVLPSPVRLLHKDSLSKDAAPGVASPASASAAAAEQEQREREQLEQQQQQREPSPPPMPSTLGQSAAADKAAKEEAADAKAAKQKATAEAPVPAQQQQQPKPKKQKQGGGGAADGAAAAPPAAPAPAGLASLAPPAGMPPLPTTLAAKAGGHDKGALSREASQEVRPAVAPTVSVTPMPLAHGAAGRAPPGRSGSDELEEGEIPPAALASAAAAEELAALRRAVERLSAAQAQARGDAAAAAKAADAAVAARVEAAVAKALAKRADEDKRRAKELEKALAQQIVQVGPGLSAKRGGARSLALGAFGRTQAASKPDAQPRARPPPARSLQANAQVLAAVNKAVADQAREQARAALQGAATALVPPLTASLAPALAASLSRELPAAAAGAAERAVAAALRGGALQEAVAAQFASRVAPAVEAAARQMFGQVEAAFAAWMAEARSQAAGAGLGATVSQLQAVVNTLQRDVAEGQRTLVRMASSSGGGGTWPGGGATAPAAPPQQDPRQRISGLIAARDYDAAFNAALSAASPELLLWVCRQMSPSALAAAEPPALSQVCLLSLVQQLGANLGPGPDAELRLDWLTEVAPLLEPGNPVIAPHLRGVLGAVMAALKALAGQLPHTDATGRKAKLAIHVVNSLLHQ
jgi:hypothetical protein